MGCRRSEPKGGYAGANSNAGRGDRRRHPTTCPTLCLALVGRFAAPSWGGTASARRAPAPTGAHSVNILSYIKFLLDYRARMYRTYPFGGIEISALLRVLFRADLPKKACREHLFAGERVLANHPWHGLASSNGEGRGGAGGIPGRVVACARRRTPATRHSRGVQKLADWHFNAHAGLACASSRHFRA